MPLFECMGASLLPNKNINITPLPNDAQSIISKASDDGYDGYEQVTVSVHRYTNGETNILTTNGTFSTIDANNKAYSNVKVDVSSDVWLATPLWSGEKVWPGNVQPNPPGYGILNPSDIDFSQYKYVVVYFKGQWNSINPEQNIEGNVFLKCGDTTYVRSGWGYKRWDPNGAGHDSDGWVTRGGAGKFRVESTGIYCQWASVGGSDVSEGAPHATRIYGLK